MRNFLCTVFIFVLFSISETICGQELKMDELVKMTKMSMQKIDSIITARKFVLVNHDSDKNYIIYHYNYRERTDSSAIFRGLTVGKMNKAGYGLEIEYGVFQKADANKIINWLLQNGFTKKVSTMPDIGGKSSFKMISYNKGKQSIGYSEEETQPGITAYLFRLNSLYF